MDDRELKEKLLSVLDSLAKAMAAELLVLQDIQRRLEKLEGRDAAKYPN